MFIHQDPLRQPRKCGDCSKLRKTFSKDTVSIALTLIPGRNERLLPLVYVLLRRCKYPALPSKIKHSSRNPPEPTTAALQHANSHGVHPLKTLLTVPRLTSHSCLAEAFFFTFRVFLPPPRGPKRFTLINDIYFLNTDIYFLNSNIFLNTDKYLCIIEKGTPRANKVTLKVTEEFNHDERNRLSKYFVFSFYN